MCEWDELNYRYIKKVISEKDKEIERLHSIIKEAREYIEDNTYKAYETEYMDLTGIKELLEILNKIEEK